VFGFNVGQLLKLLFNAWRIKSEVGVRQRSLDVGVLIPNPSAYFELFVATHVQHGEQKLLLA